ncbi:hypothetical protein N0V90_012849 [Kalmusia sp. IMI 367209]|nr:hypothetical protein N0V90_012849 [Kalmusia sp. IMI 367209]
MDSCIPLGHDDLQKQKGASQSYKRPELMLQSWESIRSEIQRLLDCISVTRRSLSRLWSSPAKFYDDWAHYRGRSSSRRCSYPRGCLVEILHFAIPNPKLLLGGTLDCELKVYESYIYLWRCMGSLSSLQWVLSEEDRLRLERIIKYQELLEMEYQVFESQLQPLRWREDELNEDQRQEEKEQRQFEIYMARFELLIRRFAIRLQIFLEFLLILCKFSGILDRDKPICMTMPWNIRPVLVVLWGVCWMFYTPQGYVDPTEIQHSIANGNANFDDWSQWVWDADLEPLPNSLDTVARLPPVNDLSSPFAAPAVSEHQTVDAEALTQTGYEQMLGLGVESNPKDVPSNSIPTLDGGALPTLQPTGVHSPVFTLEQIGRMLSDPVPLASPFLGTSTTQATHPISTSQPLSGIERGQSSPRNTEGYITCEHPQCSDLRFGQVSDWKKHNDRVHNRHTCDVSGCTKSFGSKGELYRHKQTKHNELPPHKHLRCPEPGCKYALTPHFKRKDNLTEHLRRMHNYAQPDAKARAGIQAISQARSHLESQVVPRSTPASGSQPISQLISTPASIPNPAAETTPQQDLSSDRTDAIMPRPSKRRRPGASTPHLGEASTLTRASIEEPHDETEMWKRKAAKFEGEVDVIRAQNVSLQTQNESLKSEVKRLKEHEDSLIATISALTRKS